jgi:hypothetical protein
MAAMGRGWQLAALALCVTACGQILGLYDYEDAPPSAPSTGSAGASGGGGGEKVGGGGNGGGCDPELCPGGSDCEPAVCQDELCTLKSAPIGAACDDGGNPDAHVCNGDGKCVECNDNGDCTGGKSCSQSTCVPMHCLNMTIDGGETGVDCGGPDCAQCPNGQGCGTAADCQSGFCSGNVCQPCGSDGDCAPNGYCDAGMICQPKKPDGDLCAQPKQCVSSLCTEGVCCNSPCAGVCESCLASLNINAVNGACGPVGASDPQGECQQDPANCTTGACTGLNAACAATQTNADCRPAAGPCDPAEQCDGSNVGCPADVQLMDGASCGAGLVCASGSCLTAQGQACVSSPECAFSLPCVDGYCCNGLCDLPCQGCANPGQLGFCTNYIAGSDPEGECGDLTDCCESFNFCGQDNCF